MLPFALAQNQHGELRRLLLVPLSNVPHGIGSYFCSLQAEVHTPAPRSPRATWMLVDKRKPRCRCYTDNILGRDASH